MTWARDAVRFRYIDNDSDGDVFVVQVQTPDGAFMVMGEFEEIGPTLHLRRVHIQGGDGDMTNLLGPANLRVEVEAAMERMNVSVLEIEGSARTTGAAPGRRPRILRFTR